jgi:hypothetical protein
VPVFISIDPERDTVEQIREYLKGNFNFSTTHFGPLFSVCGQPCDVKYIKGNCTVRRCMS